VPLAIFLWASNANAFTNLSLVNGSQVRVNHLIRFKESMSKPMNEPSCEPIHKPNKRLGQDALLPVNLSTQLCRLCHNKKSERVMFSNQGQDNEIQSNSTDSSNNQPSNWQGPKQRSLVISAHVPFATFCSNLSPGLNCWVHSHTGFESVTSTKKVLCSVFALLARESVTFTIKVSCSTFVLLAREPVTFRTKVSCNTFPSLVCEPVTSTNQINQDKSSATFKLVVASFLDNNALSFNDKSSFTFKLVVASITHEFLKGPTIDSPAKQRPIPNDDPAIESSLQLHIPMIIASIQQLIVALTFEQIIETQPIFQLIDVSVPNKNDLCSVFQIFAHGHNTFIESTSFNNGIPQFIIEYIPTILHNKLWELIVEYFYSLNSEQAQISKSIVEYSYVPASEGD
jgi:hypothetical protein